MDLFASHRDITKEEKKNFFFFQSQENKGLINTRGISTVVNISLVAEPKESS